MKKIFLLLVLFLLVGCLPGIQENPEPEKDFYVEWKLYHVECFGPQNLCNRVYMNNKDFQLFLYYGPYRTLDLKGIIEPEDALQIKKIVTQLAEKEEQIKNTPSCGDKNAGMFNLTFYLDKEYSFSKLYCVRNEEEAPWFGQIKYLDYLFHLQSLQFGIPLEIEENKGNLTA